MTDAPPGERDKYFLCSGVPSVFWSTWPPSARTTPVYGKRPPGVAMSLPPVGPVPSARYREAEQARRGLSNGWSLLPRRAGREDTPMTRKPGSPRGRGWRSAAVGEVRRHRRRREGRGRGMGRATEERGKGWHRRWRKVRGRGRGGARAGEREAGEGAVMHPPVRGRRREDRVGQLEF